MKFVVLFPNLYVEGVSDMPQFCETYEFLRSKDLKFRECLQTIVFRFKEYSG